MSGQYTNRPFLGSFPEERYSQQAHFPMYGDAPPRPPPRYLPPSSHSPAHWSTGNPQSHSRSYSRKRIMIIYFENHDFDDHHLKVELSGVSHWFFGRLGFEPPIMFSFDNGDYFAHDKLRTSLLDFTKRCRDNNELLVIYYAGHGGGTDGGLQLVSTANSQSQHSVYWNRLQREILYQVNAHVLVILDCCHAGMGVRGLHTYSRDVIAACASNKLTFAPSIRSFTACLMEAFEQLQHLDRFTTRQLWAQISAIAAMPWQDGSPRAEDPVYLSWGNNSAGHEIYFEWTKPAHGALAAPIPPVITVPTPQQPIIAGRPTSIEFTQTQTSWKFNYDSPSSANRADADINALSNSLSKWNLNTHNLNGYGTPPGLELQHRGVKLEANPNLIRLSQVRPNHPSPSSLPDIVIRDGKADLEWEVDEILDSRHIGGKVYYTARFADGEESERISSDFLPGCEELVADFHYRFPFKPRPAAAYGLVRVL